MDTKQIATNLAKARRKAGAPSLRTIERGLYDRIGDYAPGHQTIANYHDPKSIPAKPDLYLLCALADFYGTTVRQLSPEAADRLVNARDLLIAQMRCMTGHPARPAA